MLISIVIPCYYSEKTIQKVVELTIQEFHAHKKYQCEFVLVNDGSTDGTFEKIKELGKKYPFVHGVNLIRNFGQHNALMAALHYTKGDYVLGMDDDMQTHPSQLHFLLDEIEKASPQILDLFLSIFEEGYFYSSFGKKIDCSNAIFILTGNIGFSLNDELHFQFLKKMMKKCF